MKLNDEEQAMLAGEMGETLRWAIDHQCQVGRFFDAPDMVPVTQAHIMADPESLGDAGASFLEQAASTAIRVRVPTITDPRGIDFAQADRLGQTAAMQTMERRIIDGLERLGVLMTNTCINYQTILPPLRGEHIAMGDTGVAIYCNSVLGARTNFEGGPSALAAGLTGRTPRYGYHLDSGRRGTLRVAVEVQPNGLAEWGALGGLVGRIARSYWSVPVIDGLVNPPGSDALKHFGAALASFGSVAMFHIPGLTAECRRIEEVFDGPPPEPVRITAADLAGLFQNYAADGDKVDVVVFSAPQLSLYELADVAGLLDGKRVHPDTTLLVATSPENKSGADRMGLTARIEASGAVLLDGVCFYQSYARELAEANGWKRLMTNSAKLVNIISGYGYLPTLSSTESCVASAVAGRIVR
jgi:predicted aconitase